MCIAGENGTWCPCERQHSIQAKFKIEFLNDPTILGLGIYPKKTESRNSKEICTPKFTAALFIIGKRWKQSKSQSTGKWINKI